MAFPARSIGSDGPEAVELRHGPKGPDACCWDRGDSIAQGTSVRPGGPLLGREKAVIHPEYCYVDLAVGGVNQRNNPTLLHDVPKAFNDVSDVYVTLHRFPEEFRAYVEGNRPKGHPSVSGYSGLSWADFLPFDLDCREDLQRARSWAQNLGRTLQGTYGVREDQVRFFFSGSKGFHVLVPMELFGSVAPSFELAPLLKRVAHDLALEAGVDIDSSIYDRTRLLRCVNSRHSDSGLFKVELTWAELLNLEVSQILVLAANPRDMDWLPKSLETLPALEDLFLRAAEKDHLEPTFTNPQGGELVAKLVEALSGSWRASERNRLALAFGGWAAKLGFPLELAVEVIGKVAHRAGDDELKDRIRAVHRSFDRVRAGEDVRGFAELTKVLPASDLKIFEDLGNKRAYRENVQDPTPSDTGNSTRFVKLHGGRLRFIPRWGKWLVWNKAEGRWTLDHGDVRVRELAKDVGRQLLETLVQETEGERRRRIVTCAMRALGAHGITALVNLARGIPGIPIDHEELDRDEWLLGVQNGVVDLRTGQLRQSNPSDLMTLQCPVQWDQEAAAPRWEQAMEEWFPDPEVRSYVKRLAGAALVGGQQDHVFVIHYGGGRNGKGTFSRALQRVLGPYAGVIHHSLLVEGRFPQHDTVKAALFGIRLAVASETQRRIRLDEASVKNLTGGDRITARRMREDLWEFDPTHSLWLQTNYLPEISGRDQGIWSRIKVVKWETTFEDASQDRGLDDRLGLEAPGILRWLVEGCLEWQVLGLADPEAVVRETLAYRESEDRVSRFIADIGLVFCPNLKTLAQDLQTHLTDWAAAAGIDAPYSELSDFLKDRGLQRKRCREPDSEGKPRQRWYWIGVGMEGSNDADGKPDGPE